METSSNISATLNTAMALPQDSKPMQETKETANIPDNNKDKDDQAATQAAAQKTPSVNAMGETIGKLINVSA